MLKIVVFTFVLSFVRDSFSYPNGASAAHHTCLTMRPRHNGSQPQNTTAPYAVIVTKDTVPVGAKVDVSLVSTHGTPFKGFMMLVRLEPKRKSKPLGTFQLVDPSRSKLMNCHLIRDNTVTHSSPVPKTNISFRWIPPPKFKGTVYFEATFVQSYSIYWKMILKKVIVGETDLGDGEILSTSSPPPNEFSPHEKSSEDRSVESKHNGIYEKCLLGKCFGLPVSCEKTANCDTLVSITLRKSEFEFEVIGRNMDYIAVSLYPSVEDDVISTIECVRINENVRLYNSTIYATDSTRSAPTVNLLNASYIEGIVYCNFAKTFDSHDDRTLYGIDKIAHTLIVSVGSAERDVDEIINFENIFFNESDTFEESSFVVNKNKRFMLSPNAHFDEISWFVGLFMPLTNFILKLFSN